MNSTSLHAGEKIYFCFENINGSCSKVMLSTATQVLLYIACAIGMAIIVVGNLFVIISISHFKVLHSPTNLLVLSLAFADLLLGIVILPFSINRSVETCWYFGDSFCKLHTCMDTAFCLASIIHLCFISIDRYYAICDPLRYPSKFTIRVACKYIAVGWIAAIVYPFILLYSNATEVEIAKILLFIPCLGSCQLIFNKLWGWVNFPVFFVPCFLMIGLYIRIFIVASRQARAIHTFKDQNSQRASKRERKAAKTLGVAVGVYLLCWLPFVIDTMADTFLNYSTPPLLFEIIIWIQYFNSGCNPFIYGLFYPWFRKSLKLILTFKIFSPGSSRMNLYED
ncbi:trace amine-associated receptor 5-like [Latimeria chalumnae]|uniref:trace amine-associated receptor 5-like n=1 Tax=Latimeria chalumnae TaxID=7897 RepID=UPI0003C1817B|nr:PREDICTED: trace amine-associated receptor 5-like [Latimeria chalumnae]|eukprot:XP_006012007.1 PREDICTED: trace amine-associated receptor 5-like [Latimeria chalumnae]